jgi:hypothetical protein
MIAISINLFASVNVGVIMRITILYKKLDFFIKQLIVFWRRKAYFFVTGFRDPQPPFCMPPSS